MTELSIPVTKAKATVTIDTDAVPERYYEAALINGFKVIINGGATKITKEAFAREADPEGAYATAALEKANERVAAMMEDKLKLGRQAAEKGPSGPVMTEARRIARQLVKDTLRSSGQRLTAYSASDITVAANAVIKSDPNIIKMAEHNLAERGKTKLSIDISGLISADPKLAAKAKSKKKDEILSAAQAGKVAPRAQHATH